MHFHRFACKIVLKITTEIRKRRDMCNPLQAVNSKYKTVDTAIAIMSQSKRGKGSFKNHVDTFFDFLDPLSPSVDTP